MSHPPRGRFNPGYPQGSYPQQGGYPAYPGPPKKSNTALIATVVGVALAAVAAAVLVVVLSADDKCVESGDRIPGPPDESTGPGTPRGTSGGGSGSGGIGAATPRKLADEAVAIIKNRTLSHIEGLSCSATAAAKLKDNLTMLPGGAEARVAGVEENGDTAQAKIALTKAGSIESVTIEMAKQGGKWCATGI